MKPETFTSEEKVEIARHIKAISMEEVDREMKKLRDIGTMAANVPARSLIGNKVVDYFTFVERLETKGKYHANFYEFLANMDWFREKKYIQTMLTYYRDVKNKNGTKHEYKVYKEVYNICISSINIMRPLNCMEMYARFQAKRVLNFCAGWGGSTVAAAALNLDAFYGVEINRRLEKPYADMITYLQGHCDTEFHLRFADAATDVDYSQFHYDMVFASPPYYFIEQYPGNVAYTSREDMDDRFYTPVFSKTYEHLQPGGHFVVNLCAVAYERTLVPLLGPAHEMFPLKKSKRQNDHTEMVYVWRKPPLPSPLLC